MARPRHSHSIIGPDHNHMKRKAKKYFWAQKVRQRQRQNFSLMKTLGFSGYAGCRKLRHLSPVTATAPFDASKDESARKNPIVPTLPTICYPQRKIPSAPLSNIRHPMSGAPPRTPVARLPRHTNISPIRPFRCSARATSEAAAQRRPARRTRRAASSASMS